MAGSEAARHDIAAAIAESYRRRVGGELVHCGDVSLDDAMMSAPGVILCHDGKDDPTFIYANHAASSLWRMPVNQLIGLPSRLSAPPEQRAERGRALAQAASNGVLFGYTGERIAADGTRFVIEDATLWTVDLPDGSLGQAVVFDTWSPLPVPSDESQVR